MSYSAKVRFAMIGAGGIAQAYAQAFETTPDAELVGVVDVREDAAQAVAERLNCQPFTTVDGLLASADFDAAIVCTPPSTHPDICSELMSRGKHVLCEKPLAVSSEAAAGMLDAAQKYGVKFTMASKFRYVDDVKRAKAIVASGILGDIILYENTFTGYVDMSRRWNSDPDISGGGVLIDNGTHSVDIMRYFLGPLKELQVVEGRRIQNLPVEDTVRLHVQSESGVLGSIDLSWSMNKEQPAYISIYGSDGTVLVGWKESKYRRSSDQDWIVFGNGYSKVEAFFNQIQNFALAIRDDEPLVITAADAMASVEVIEAAYRSLKQSRWLPVSGTMVGGDMKSANDIANTAGSIS